MAGEAPAQALCTERGPGPTLLCPLLHTREVSREGSSNAIAAPFWVSIAFISFLHFASTGGAARASPRQMFP